GSWTVERTRGDDVLETGRLELHHHLGEATRLHLKHARRVTSRNELEGGRVGDGDLVGLQLLVWRPVSVDERQGVLDDGECRQAEKVELHQPRGLHLVL